MQDMPFNRPLLAKLQTVQPLWLYKQGKMQNDAVTSLHIQHQTKPSSHKDVSLQVDAINLLDMDRQFERDARRYDYTSTLL